MFGCLDLNCNADDTRARTRAGSGTRSDTAECEIGVVGFELLDVVFWVVFFTAVVVGVVVVAVVAVVAIFILAIVAVVRLLDVKSVSGGVRLRLERLMILVLRIRPQ
jgi:hypothetical protein